MHTLFSIKRWNFSENIFPCWSKRAQKPVAPGYTLLVVRRVAGTNEMRAGASFCRPDFDEKKRFFKRNLAHYLVQKWANKSDGREKQAILANTGSSTREFVEKREKF